MSADTCDCFVKDNVRAGGQNRPTASTLFDIMQVQHMSRKIRENAETFPYLAKL